MTAKRQHSDAQGGSNEPLRSFVYTAHRGVYRSHLSPSGVAALLDADGGPRWVDFGDGDLVRIDTVVAIHPVRNDH